MTQYWAPWRESRSQATAGNPFPLREAARPHAAVAEHRLGGA
jgi:hypothetical protein